MHEKDLERVRQVLDTGPHLTPWRDDRLKVSHSPSDAATFRYFTVLKAGGHIAIDAIPNLLASAGFMNPPTDTDPDLRLAAYVEREYGSGPTRGTEQSFVFEDQNSSPASAE